MQKQTILIAEDDADLAHFLTMKCRALGFEVFRSPDAMHALLGAHRMKPSLIVLDLKMPGGNGLAVCEMLASDYTVSSIPVIVMSGQSDQDTILRCKMAGARYLPKGPNLWSELSKAMHECLEGETQAPSVDDAVPTPDAVSTDVACQMQPSSSSMESSGNRPKIISIDDDPELSRILKLRLEPYGVEVFRSFGGSQGFWTCLDVQPDVIIADLNMSDGDGNYLLHRLRAHSLTEKTPVIILTGQTNPGVRRLLLSQGVEAYLNKPLVVNELLEHLRPLVRLEPVIQPAHRCSGDILISGGRS